MLDPWLPIERPSKTRGVSRISGKGVHMYNKAVEGVALLILVIFLKYPMKRNNLVSLRPNYYLFMGI